MLLHAHSARNKDQKLVGHFLKIGLTAVSLKLYGKFGQPKWFMVGQMLKLVGK